MKELHRVGIKDIKMNKDELTLDNSQEDNNDEEEKGDVEKDAVELVGVSGRVLDLVPYASTCPHPDVHVEEVTLWTGGGGSAMTSEHLCTFKTLNPQSSCRRISCRARLRPRSCCRTS